MKIKVTAPGSLMLMGEHAVLFGQRALACAVDKRIAVTLTPRADRTVTIDSALAQYRSELDQLLPSTELSFVLTAIQRQAAVLPGGFDLLIQTEFSHTVGLGSSAAVTAAVVTALQAFAGKPCSDPLILFKEALSVVHQVQDGRGSGTDLVAAVYGGVVGYTVALPGTEPQIRALGGIPPISLFYVGYKMKTPDVLKRVEGFAAQAPQLYTGLYQLMGQTAEQAEQAVDRADWPQLGRLMNIYQGLMDALGVNDRNLAEIIYSLRSSPEVLGAKISGSGLGDCVLALGNPSDYRLTYEQIPVAVSAEGVTVEYL
ncbi:mevalonate kinase [Amphritea atlantica]|uniref:Mevalonate kinase n=1 Tax=Amphritea atlantica TaxID=355243 RepID=A0A1H9HAT6_9GAMM|nr:GHMP kinase [Amphritea atlantica]SEQ59444.1 mevalonate kinase [Amphritea atlantica]